MDVAFYVSRIDAGGRLWGNVTTWQGTIHQFTEGDVVVPGEVQAPLPFDSPYNCYRACLVRRRPDCTEVFLEPATLPADVHPA